MSAIRAPGARLLLYMLALAGGAVAAHLSAPAATGAKSPATVIEPRLSAVPVAEAPATPGSASGALLPVLEAATPTLTADSHDALGSAFKRGKIITGGTPHRLILFTFDDGPDRRHTPLLLDRLDAEGVKAVFFLTASRMLGRNLAERQQIAIARDIAARGHIVASHTLDHEQLPLLDDDAAMAQVLGAERVFEKVFGARPWLFRPPGGAHSPRIDKLLAQHGYTTMLWNLGAGDFQVRSAQDVYQTWKRVFERREQEHGERGGIILLHDTYPWSVDAFQMILADLRARNCELLKRGEELFDIVDDPALFFAPRGKGPADARAEPAKLASSVLSRRQERLQRRAMAHCTGL